MIKFLLSIDYIDINIQNMVLTQLKLNIKQWNKKK